MKFKRFAREIKLSIIDTRMWVKGYIRLFKFIKLVGLIHFFEFSKISNMKRIFAWNITSELCIIQANNGSIRVYNYENNEEIKDANDETVLEILGVAKR